MVLFITASVYQIFNAINIKKSMYDDNIADIVILDMGSGITNNISEENLHSVFNNVYLVKAACPKNKVKKFIYVLFSICRKNVFGISISGKYSSIFLSGTEVHSKIVMNKVREKKGKVFYYEDGMASYYSVLNNDTKKKEDFIFKFLYGKRPLEMCQGLYAYAPECVHNNTDKINIYQIPKINKLILKLPLKEIYKADILNFHKKFVFLSSWFLDPNMYHLQEELIQVVVESVGIENICNKVHPNEIGRKKKNTELEIIDDKAGLEVINYYFDLHDKVFISIVSTACFTPKLVYGQEPLIIFLYKIFQKKFDLWKDIDDVIKDIGGTYSDSDKVFVPENISDLKTILNRLKNKFYFEQNGEL